MKLLFLNLKQQIETSNMMEIKEIEFIHEVKDLTNDSIDVGVVFQDDHCYTIVVCIPENLLIFFSTDVKLKFNYLVDLKLV